MPTPVFFFSWFTVRLPSLDCVSTRPVHLQHLERCWAHSSCSVILLTKDEAGLHVLIGSNLQVTVLNLKSKVPSVCEVCYSLHKEKEKKCHLWKDPWENGNQGISVGVGEAGWEVDLFFTVYLFCLLNSLSCIIPSKFT